MSRNTKTIIAIVGTIVIFLVLSVMANELGSPIAKAFILKAGGINHTEWVKYYSGLVKLVGLVSCLITLYWYISTRFIKKITYPTGVNCRGLWIVLGALNIGLCFIIPWVYSIMNKKFPMSIIICIFFAVLFSIGYYVVSLIFTPDSYKYTPWGAMKVRRMRGKKR